MHLYLYVLRIFVSAMLVGIVAIHCNLPVTACLTVHVKCVMQGESGDLSCIVWHFL